MTEQENWVGRFVAWANGTPPGAVIAATFPEYRPDLVDIIAAALGAELLDFRKEIMMPLGWRASSLAVESLLEAARGPLRLGRPVVLQNAEALLSLVPSPDRRAWFAATLDLAFPARLVLPLALYGAELPAGHGGVYAFTNSELPEVSLLALLPGLR